MVPCQLSTVGLGRTDGVGEKRVIYCVMRCRDNDVLVVLAAVTGVSTSSDRHHHHHQFIGSKTRQSNMCHKTNRAGQQGH